MHRANADQQELSGAPARPCVPWHGSVFWEERWPGGLDCGGLWVCAQGLLVQRLCQAVSDEWDVTKRHV